MKSQQPQLRLTFPNLGKVSHISWPQVTCCVTCHITITRHVTCHALHVTRVTHHMTRSHVTLSRITCYMSHPSHDHHVTIPRISQGTINKHHWLSHATLQTLLPHSMDFYRRLVNPYVQLCINTPRNALKNLSSFSCEYISVPWLTDPPESSFLSFAPVCTLIAYLASVVVEILSDNAVASILLSLCLVSIAFNVALLYSSRRYLFPCISRPSPPASAVA